MKTFANLLLAALFSLVCNVAQGQTTVDKVITIIPEFETIIKDAEKTGKDPLEIARYNKENNIWSMAEYIRFSKYIRGKQDKEAAETKARIEKLDKEAAETKVKIEKANDAIDLVAKRNLHNIHNLYLADPKIFLKKPDWLEFINEICINKKQHYRAEVIEFVEVNFKNELSVDDCSRPKNIKQE